MKHCQTPWQGKKRAGKSYISVELLEPGSDMHQCYCVFPGSSHMALPNGKETEKCRGANKIFSGCHIL